jgi:hypothetical protein
MHQAEACLSEQCLENRYTPSVTEEHILSTGSIFLDQTITSLQAVILLPLG